MPWELDKLYHDRGRNRDYQVDAGRTIVTITKITDKIRIPTLSRQRTAGLGWGTLSGPDLVGLNRLRQLERYAALVVLLAGGLKVQIPDGEFVPVSGCEVEQRLA